jgi:hypothetical protein
MAEGHGGDTMMQPWLWQGGHHPEATTARGRHHAHGRAAEHSTMVAMSGLQGCRPADEAVKSHRKHRGARVEAPARPARVDQAARARSTERSSAVMAMLGGEIDETPRSGESTWQGGADAP